MSATPLVPNNLSALRFLAGTNIEDGITATASGTQATAYQLSAQMSTLDTVATAADSVALPKVGVRAVGDANPGGPGYLSFVYNNTANAAQVYGVTPDTINGVATATGISLPAGAMLIAWVNTYTQSSNVGEWQAAVLAGTSIDRTIAGNLTVGGSVTSASANIAGNFAINGNTGTYPMTFQAGLETGAVTQTMHVVPRPLIVSGVSLSFANASTSGTFMLEKLTGNTAPGSGTTMLTSTMNLAGPNNNVVVGTMNATAATLAMTANDRIGAVFAGTMTNLLGLNITVIAKPK